MQVDFRNVEDIESFVSIPEGVYECTIAEVRVGETKDGNERWAMRLEVAEGDYAGRTAAWDGLVFSPRALPRAKEVLDRLGFDVSGSLSFEPHDLQGRTICAHIINEEREDPISGKRVVRTRVPYMGYQSAREEEPTAF